MCRSNLKLILRSRQDKQYALVQSRFAVIAPKKIKQWRVRDTRGFDGLQAALAASEAAIDSLGTEALEAAAAQGSGARSRPARTGRRRRKTCAWSKKDVRVEKFIKAARVSLEDGIYRLHIARGRSLIKNRNSRNSSLLPQFVRGHGAAAIHPSAKIQLHGLLMQAQKGDCPETENQAGAEQESGSVGALRGLKLAAWRSLKGTGQEKAMEQYIDLLTSLAPNWKVAHIVLGRESEEDRRKPRPMMWVLKVGFREVKEEEEEEEETAILAARADRTVSRTRSRAQRVAMRITSIEVLQSSSEANAMIWNEEKAAPKESVAAIGDESLSDVDPYLKSL